MIHHVSFGTRDARRAKAFYDPVLAVVGWRCIQSSDRAVDYGVSDIMFSLETPSDGGEAAAGNGGHVAFAARDRDTVDRFHRTALENGGTDAGAPGLRPDYDAHYYGAFVRDPDGNKIEAVTLSAKRSA
jgi:catechol 2,3-dioxygenase-like lactoylglutathione lyase family enzyme